MKKIILLIIFSIFFIPVISTAGALSGSFTFDVSKQIVTLSPTISNDVDFYRFIIDDDYTFTTDWTPRDDINDHICFLEYNTTYAITMQVKNGSNLGFYSRTLRMASAPSPDEPDIVEPIEIIDDSEPRRNLFSGVPEGLSDWWDARNGLEKLVILLPFIVLLCFLIVRRKKIKVYFYLKGR